MAATQQPDRLRSYGGNMKEQSGWACPKCGKVYSPKVEECKDCNEAIQKAIPYIPYVPYVPQPEPYRPWPWAEPWITWTDSTTWQPPPGTYITC